MKKNNNKFNLKVSVLAVSLLVLNTSAHAQWVVTDPGNLVQNIMTYAKEAFTSAQSYITAAQTTISAEQNILTAGYTYLTSRAAASTGQKVAQNTEAVNLGTQQSIKNTEIRDMQERKALGDSEMGKTAMGLLPNMAQCAEASKAEAKAAAVGAAARGSGGGKNKPKDRAEEVTTTAQAQAAILETKQSLGTCSKEIAGAANCSGNGAYANADIHPRGIKGDIKGIAQDDETKPSFNSNTLDTNAWNAAVKYASDMAFYDKPKVPNETQMKKNPSYAALYSSMQTKLYAANDAVLDIMKFRRAASSDITSSVAGQEWAKISSSDYKKVTGLETKPQKSPSLFDMVNYQIRNDFLGNKDAKLDSTEEVNKRLAALSFVAWQQYQQQENTNLLLAHILVQLTTPINKSQVDNEYAKTMNIK